MSETINMYIRRILSAALLLSAFCTTALAQDPTNCGSRVNFEPGPAALTGLAGTLAIGGTPCVEVNNGTIIVGYAPFEFVGLENIVEAEWDIYFPAYSSVLGDYTAGIRLATYAPFDFYDGIAAYLAYGSDGTPMMTLYINVSNEVYAPGSLVYFQTGGPQPIGVASAVPEVPTVSLLIAGLVALQLASRRMAQSRALASQA